VFICVVVFFGTVLEDFEEPLYITIPQNRRNMDLLG